MLKKLLCILFLLPSMAMAAEFVEGKDYQVVAQSPNNVIKGPTVTEFFSYGCPWCYKMESPLNEWSGKLGKAVRIDRVPVVFKPDWALYAKAYYTAKTLALADKMNPLLFKAIQDDKQGLNSKQSMIDFFAANGVDKEIAKSAFESSPTIDMRVNNGMALMAHYQIRAVPAFVVNNHYKTDLQMAGSPERLFKIMNFLMKRPA
ncbi:MAG: thiol:disulfide interchange protein DsbA/DsbL [Legionella sp.]|nr:MAG: thiol:disulfide interchange protein DsbA/DsbL [Legionella sp.]